MSPVEQKLERLSRGDRPRVLDLFSGCGGFSLGFSRAGCEILGGVELDPQAAASHALNFHGTAEGPHARPRDITIQKPGDLLRELGHPEAELAVDIIIGGPPCPAFTRVGRAKLREIHEHPTAYKQDPRAALYLPYLSYVRALQPLILVMENVPDVVNFGGHNLAEEICEVLEDEAMGYSCQYTLLNSVNYGVPQMRERFFLVGVHRAVAGTFRFPQPSHGAEMPPGYLSARQVALKTLTGADSEHFVEPPAAPDLRPAVTAAAALDDLPPLTGHLLSPNDRTARYLDSRGASARGDRGPSSWVATHMLGWPGFGASSADNVVAHVTRGLGHRDHRLFRLLEEGDQYPEAWQLAQTLWRAFRTEAFQKTPLPDLYLRALQLAGRIKGFWHLCSGASGEPSLGIGCVRLWKSLRADIVALQLGVNEVVPDLDDLARQSDLGPTIRFSLASTDRIAAIDSILGDLSGSPDWGQLPKLAGRLRANYREAVGRHRRRDAFRRAETWDDRADVDRLPCVVAELGPRLFKARFIEVAHAVAALPAEPLLFWPFESRAVPLLGLASFEAAGLGEDLDLLSDLQAEFVPPYDPSKFPNKWRKMESDAPCRTLMAHLGKDTYSHIHYDSDQARTISVREAARLQSFPDGFRLQGRMNAGFRQVGNAVPPLLSYALARSVTEALGLSAEQDGEGHS